MSENQKSIFVDLILGLVISASIVVVKYEPGYSLLYLLSDCTFVPAVVLLGLGGLRFCTNSGSLDMLGYGFKTVGEFFTKAGRLDGPDEDYYEYCQRKAQERKPFGHYLIVGLVFLVLSAVLLVIHSMIGA